MVRKMLRFLAWLGFGSSFMGFCLSLDPEIGTQALLFLSVLCLLRMLDVVEGDGYE